ncbi:MAG: adenylate/guanylate cyclase domain-containing protein [Elusimicrobia bacterium]|nr:adenylate/guanylate cyclase domain-containing protein [Elusimicrobiota bacterium]
MAFKISLLVSLLILAAILFMARMILKTTEEALVHEMRVRAQFFARSCREALFPKVDPFQLHFNTQEILKEKAVVYAEILDPMGKILSHSEPRWVGEAEESPAGRRALASTETLLQKYSAPGQSEPYYDLAIPVFAGARRAGTVRLGFTQGSIRGALFQQKAKIFGIALISLILAILGTTGAVGWIMRPLPRLASAAEEVGRGKLDVEVSWRSRDEIGRLTKAFNQMIKGLKERDFIRQVFGRYVSPEIAETVLKGNLSLGGERRFISVLFSDIRNFTHFSEKLPPEEVVLFLNEYFSRMMEVAEKYHGTVDKFIGDALFVMFGAPLPLEDHAVRAVQTAQEMVREVERLSCERTQAGKEPVRIGVAIHSGIALAGNIGSSHRAEYTVIGDTVNLASHLEGLNKRLGTSVLVSSETYRLVQGRFPLKPLGAHRVRGREETVEVYQLEC